MDAHFAGMMQKVIDVCGPLSGKSLNNVLIDSYEAGSQNWTARLPEEFKARAGYDLTPFLPVYTGRVVESVAASERFLFDLRRTIVELFAENYYGRMAELCHQHGLKFCTEPYGNGTFDDMLSGSKADMPMGEFWVGATTCGSCKLAASIGHVYGRPVIGAESFTCGGTYACWTEDPYAPEGPGRSDVLPGHQPLHFSHLCHAAVARPRPRHDDGPVGHPFPAHQHLVGAGRGMAQVPDPLPVSLAAGAVRRRCLLTSMARTSR